jgi:ER-bound oxygenase mpaB/B'/Rubber oxygenase, catalytic domain
MEYFVDKKSIVRQIWGKSDTILFIFAAASAEFAVNKAVDWLYFTGRLPADPLGRLFSTVSYARAIIFSENQAAHRAIDSMTSIHSNVEAKRGAKIPDWAYRDVLFMLIDYSIRSFEILERQLTVAEKEEVLQVFNAVGSRMGLTGLPKTYETWQTMRQEHLNNDLKHSDYTADLFNQYRKHLGIIRYRILLEVQKGVIPHTVCDLLRFRKTSFIRPVLMLYSFSKLIKADWILKSLLLPARYKKQILALDNLQAK